MNDYKTENYKVSCVLCGRFFRVEKTVHQHEGNPKGFALCIKCGKPLETFYNSRKNEMTTKKWEQNNSL